MAGVLPHIDMLWFESTLRSVSFHCDSIKDWEPSQDILLSECSQRFRRVKADKTFWLSDQVSLCLEIEYSRLCSCFTHEYASVLQIVRDTEAHA